MVWPWAGGPRAGETKERPGRGRGQGEGRRGPGLTEAAGRLAGDSCSRPRLSPGRPLGALPQALAALRGPGPCLDGSDHSCAAPALSPPPELPAAGDSWRTRPTWRPAGLLASSRGPGGRSSQAGCSLHAASLPPRPVLFHSLCVGGSGGWRRQARPLRPGPQPRWSGPGGQAGSPAAPGSQACSGGAAAGVHTAAQEGARGSARAVRESYHHTPGPQVDGGGTAQLLGVLVCWGRHTPVLSEPWTDVRGAILLLGSSRLMGGTDPPF